MIGKVANAVGYQVVWFTSVIGAAHGLAYAGPVAACIFAILTIMYGGARHPDLRLIPLALLIGVLADSAWIALGWLHYSAPWPSAQFAPAWIVGIWLSFAMTLNHSMAFLKGRYALAAVLGGIGGPLAYWSASRGFGAVHFDASASTVLIGLGIGWAVVFPLLVRVAEPTRASTVRVALP